MNRRIAFVTDEGTDFASRHQLEVLLEGLRGRGWSCDRFHCMGPSSRPRKLPEKGRFKPAIPVPYHRWLRPGVIRQQLLASDPALVHNWCGGPWMGRGLTRLDVPLVETQLCTDSCIGNRNWNRWIGQPDIFATDHAARSEQRFPRGHEPAQVHVIGGGVDVSDIHRQQVRQRLLTHLRLPLKTVLVTTLTPWAAESDLKDLIWACDLLKCIRDDVHLLICGEGNYRWQLQKFARCTEAASHIHFLPSNPFAWDAVHAADLYWSSATDPAQPLGVLWSMAARIPVVSVLSASNRELIRPQQTALAVELGRRDQYARWSKYLLEQNEARDQLVDQAFRLVSGHYSASAMVEHYEQLYLSLR